jgi:tetratricopeptide (TPR) repeat protein
MMEKRFDIDAQDNARVNMFGEVNADSFYVGDRIYAQQQVSVLGLDTIPPQWQIDSWIERSQPQAELLRRVAQTALIEMVAQGGFGKSLLAAWLFDRIRNDYPKALWVNFRKQPSFSQFALWVLQELGFLVTRPQVTDAELVQELTYRLTTVHGLLVLDQLEAIDRDRDTFAAFLQQWQRQGRNSTVLVTTRVSFGLAALDRMELLGLSEAEGAALLAHRGISAIADHGFERFVQMAQGHPLLLNLAASWLRQESKGYLHALDLGFFQELFQQVPEDAEAQVGAMFAKLFAELPERLRSLLMGIVVYRDAFDLERAQAMLPDTTPEELRWLTQRALLLEENECWRLHPLIQNLVAQELAASDRWRRQVHEQAIAYFTAKIKPSKATIADCAEELEIFHHRCELGEYAFAYQIIDTCDTFLDRRGYYRELLPIYVQLTRDWHPAAADEQLDLGWAWTRLASLYRSVGMYQDAIDADQQAQTLFYQIGDRNGEATALFNQAQTLAKYESRRFEALTLLQQARAIYLELELNHRVELCDDAIRDFNLIIATEQRQSAPSLPVASAIDNPPAPNDWYTRSLPTPPKPRNLSSGHTKWILWFCAGVSIVFLIAWLRSK